MSLRTIAAVVSLWRLLDPTRVDETFPPLLTALLSVLGAQREASSRLAASYLAAFTVAELGVGVAPALAPPSPLPAGAVATSLTVTGPVAIKRSSQNGLSAPVAADQALARVAAASSRHALDGGRERVLDTVTADPRARGWARVTDSAPCAFCALLASRGPVYTASSGDFRAHDACGCSVEPVYRDDTRWPGRSREWADLYREVASGDPDALNAFRRAYERRSAQAAG